jgi:hypothetical protein
MAKKNVKGAAKMPKLMAAAQLPKPPKTAKELKHEAAAAPPPPKPNSPELSKRGGKGIRNAPAK